MAGWGPNPPTSLCNTAVQMKYTLHHMAAEVYWGFSSTQACCMMSWQSEGAWKAPAPSAAPPKKNGTFTLLPGSISPQLALEEPRHVARSPRSTAPEAKDICRHLQRQWGYFAPASPGSAQAGSVFPSLPCLGNKGNWKWGRVGRLTRCALPLHCLAAGTL